MLKVCCDRLAVFVGYVAERISNHMDNAQPHLGFRKDRFNGIRKAGKPVTAGDEDVFESSILKLRQYMQPKFGGLVLGHPHPQALFVTGQVNAKRQVNCFVVHPSVLSDFDHDGIKIDDGINRVKGTVLPDFTLRFN
jgi:hypothetical protein